MLATTHHMGAHSVQEIHKILLEGVPPNAVCIPPLSSVMATSKALDTDAMDK